MVELCMMGFWFACIGLVCLLFLVCSLVCCVKLGVFWLFCL